MASAQQLGQQARGKVIAGIGAQMIREAASMFPIDSDENVSLTKSSLELAKMFMKPPEDLGMAELKFMASQLWGQGGGGSPLDGGAQTALDQVGAGQALPAQGGASPIPIPELPRPPGA